MKDFVFLIFISIAMTFVASKYYFESKNSVENKKISFDQVAPIRQMILEDMNYGEIMDFSKLFAGRSLFQNTINLQNIFFNINKSLRRNFTKSSDCQNQSFPSFIKLSSYNKMFIWNKFICSQLNKLPDKFFETPPFLSVNNESFAFNYYVINKKKTSIANWVKKNIRFFKISELRKIDSKIVLKQPYFNFSKLSLNELGFIGRSEDIFALRDHVFIKANDKKYLDNFFSSYISGNSSTTYKIVNLKLLNSFLSKSPFVFVKFNKNKKCAFLENNVCWKYSFKHLLIKANKATLISFILAIILIILTLWQLIKKFRLQKNEENRRRLALQILTHEFRTPITSLLLVNENLNQKYEQMSPDVQNLFIKMSGDIFRLQRLTEMSKNYLQASDKDKILQKKVKINSIKLFLEDFIIDYIDSKAKEIKVFLNLTTDFSVDLDIYWLQICLKNLIENAIRHGVAPYNLTCYKTESDFIIEVSDCGECQFSKLNEITTEFTKGNKSEGTGLGLSIVSKVMHELGGKLSFSTNPTTFSLSFKI